MLVLAFLVVCPQYSCPSVTAKGLKTVSWPEVRLTPRHASRTGSVQPLPFQLH